MALKVDVNSSSRWADLSRQFSHQFSRQFSGTARACLLSLYRCYVRTLICPMVQVGYTMDNVVRVLDLYGIHNLGPAALGSVYPVGTSTSLYNLYVTSRKREIALRGLTVV